MIQLKFCSVEWTTFGARTVFADGLECSTWPHDSEDYRLIADRLGYGFDTLAFARDHDLAHACVSEWVHDQRSPTLYAVAQGQSLPWTATLFEELAAQTLQRLVRQNVRPVAGGFDWGEWRTRFLDLTMRLEMEWERQVREAA